MSNTTTSSNVRSARSSAAKFAFTYDHVNKKIVGTDIDFQKSGIPGSKQEEELMARIAKQPTYTFAVIETEKKPAKRTYKGLDRKLMEAYIAIQEEQAKANLTARLSQMIADESAFPTIRSWFLDEFPGFSVSKAQREIQKHNLTTTKAKVRAIKASAKPAPTKEQPKVVNF